MGHLEETSLPGIGKRLEFFADEDRRMGVVQHHGGRRGVFVCEPADPHTTDVSIDLSEGDAHSLVEALAVVSITEDAGQRTYDVESIGTRGRLRAAAALTARGEFSIVIAGLGVTAEVTPRLSAIAAGYVLLTATLGPIAALLVHQRSASVVTGPARA